MSERVKNPHFRGRVNDARLAWREVERKRRAMLRWQDRYNDALVAWDRFVDEAEARLSVHVPYFTEPHALDVLLQVDPDSEAGHWFWTGQLNNKGTATVRRYGKNGTERSAFKIVHQIVVGEEHKSPLGKPRCGERTCMRPDHRCRTCADNTPRRG